MAGTGGLHGGERKFRTWSLELAAEYFDPGAHRPRAGRAFGTSALEELPAIVDGRSRLVRLIVQLSQIVMRGGAARVNRACRQKRFGKLESEELDQRVVSLASPYPGSCRTRASSCRATVMSAYGPMKTWCHVPRTSESMRPARDSYPSPRSSSTSAVASDSGRKDPTRTE